MPSTLAVSATTALTLAPIRFTRSAPPGVRGNRTSSAPASGAAGTAIRSRSVTQRLQQRAVATTELLVNLRRESRRDRHDPHQIEYESELDEHRQTAGQRQPGEIDPVLGDQKPERLEEHRATHDRRQDSERQHADRGVFHAGAIQAEARDQLL